MPKNLNYIIIITIHWKSIIYISLKNLITSSPEIQFGFKFKKIKMQKYKKNFVNDAYSY